MYYVYIVRCSDTTLYTGITTDVSRRIRQHNGEIVGGAKYTANRQPVILVFQTCFENRSDACKEESKIKKLSRKEKIKIINMHKAQS